MKQFKHVDDYRELWTLLLQVRDAMYKVRQLELDKHDMLLKQSRILGTILALGNQATPTEISMRLLRRRNSISEHLTRMERKGLIRRVKDLSKKNQVRIDLTEKGLEAYLQGHKLESIVDIMSNLSDEELGQFEEILKKLRHISLGVLETDVTPLGVIDRPHLNNLKT